MKKLNEWSLPLNLCVIAVSALVSVGHAPALRAQPPGMTSSASPMVTGIPKQPLVVHVDQVLKALAFVGRPVSDADRNAIYAASQLPDDQAVAAIQQILDRYALVRLDIDENRHVTVVPMSGAAETLTKNGWSTFLVKVENQAKSTDVVDVDSPEAAMPYDFSRMQVERSVYDDQFTDVMLEHVFQTGVTWGTWGGGYPYKPPPQPEQTAVWPAHGDLSFVPGKDRWAAVSLYQGKILSPNLSGFPLEYLVLQVYSRDEGTRSMTLSVNIGKLASSGTGSVPFIPGSPGFRGETQLRFNVQKAVPVTLNILDENNHPTAARLTIRDQLGPGLSLSKQALCSRLVFPEPDLPL